MLEKTEKSQDKKAWKKPELIDLNIKRTQGGGQALEPEDDTYNPTGS
jgi:hypothetical protein